MAESVKLLRSRWQSAEGVDLARSVVAHLVERRPLTDLGPAITDGRIDLRGITFPEPRRAATLNTGNVAIEELAGLVELRGVALKGLDFSHARLPSLRIFDSTIEDSKFDGAYCRDWRVWRVQVSRTSFRHADLRSAALGAWNDGRGSAYASVDFAGADLRGLVSPAATYIDCDFAGARLDGIDFESSGFVRCRFVGDLRDVTFWDHGFRTGKPDPNPMEDIDFSQAQLRFVDFRRLDLDRVLLPTSPEHIIVSSYRCVLVHALASFEGDDTPLGRRSRALLQHRLKWCGPNQRVGVFHMDELGDTARDAAVLRDRLLTCEAACAAE